MVPTLTQLQVESRYARLRRLYRRLKALPEPEPWEIRWIEYRFRDLLGKRA